MATTTDFETIRENYLRLIEQLTPTSYGGHKFARLKVVLPLRMWGAKSDSSAFRVFGMYVEDGGEEPPMQHPQAYQKNEIAVLEIAYPLEPGLYHKQDGDADLDNVEDLINADAEQVRLTLVDATNYVAAQHNCVVQSRALDRSDERTWFYTFRLLLTYEAAQVRT